MQRVKDHKFLYRRGDRYYFRRKAPKGLERAFGDQPIVTVALHTSELSKARRRLAAELEKFEQTVEDARAPLSAREFGTLSSATTAVEAPSKIEMEAAVRRWLTERMERASLAVSHSPATTNDEATWDAHQSSVQQGLRGGASDPTQTTIWVAEAIAEREKWPVDHLAPWWRSLVAICGRGQIETDQWLLQDFRGEPRRVQDARFHPEQYRLDAEREQVRIRSKPTDLSDLLALCIAEKQVQPATAKVWKRHVAHFVSFLGHADAAKVVLADVVGWKEHLLAEPGKAGVLLSRRTIRDSYLACIKALFA